MVAEADCNQEDGAIERIHVDECLTRAAKHSKIWLFSVVSRGVSDSEHWG